MQHKRGFRVGRPRGLRMVIHGSWIPAALLGCAHLTVSVFGAYGLLPAIGLSVVTMALVFASVVWREAGRGGGRRGMSEEVIVYPFGGVRRSAAPPERPAAEAVGAVRAIVAKAALAGACYAASVYVPGPGGRVLWATAMWNGGLAALHALPVVPLDGGRVARAVLWARSGDGPSAARRVARWGQISGTALLAAGVVLFTRDPAAQAGWAGLWLAVAGLFVVVMAGRMRSAAKLEAALGGRTAGSWALPFTGRLRPDDVVPDTAGTFAVADGGRLAGIASGAWAGSVASEAMVPWSSRLSCSASDPLHAALARMSASGAGALVVLDERGIVRGVLSRDVMREQLRGGR